VVALRASHWLSAAFTSIGFSWAIQWPEATTTRFEVVAPLPQCPGGPSASVGAASSGRLAERSAQHPRGRTNPRGWTGCPRHWRRRWANFHASRA
jgi:hypothetical protein